MLRRKLKRKPNSGPNKTAALPPTPLKTEPTESPEKVLPKVAKTTQFTVPKVPELQKPTQERDEKSSFEAASVEAQGPSLAKRPKILPEAVPDAVSLEVVKGVRVASPGVADSFCEVMVAPAAPVPVVAMDRLSPALSAPTTPRTLAEELAAETLESQKRIQTLLGQRHIDDVTEAADLIPQSTTFARPLTPVDKKPQKPKQKRGNKRGKKSENQPERRDVLEGVDFDADRPVADLLGNGVDLNAPDQVHNRAAYFKYSRNGRLDDDDVRSIVSVTNSTTSTASTTYHRLRAQEVKAKMKNLPKDEDGQVVIDKTTFCLADVIYVNRHHGRKKTGLQVKREEYEKRLAVAKQEKKKQAEEMAKKELDEKNGIIQEPPSVASKMEVCSTIGSTVDNSDIKSCISDSDGPPTMVKSIKEPMKAEINPDIPLTQDQITEQNRKSADNVKVRVNERGELIVDTIQNSIVHPTLKKQEDCERELADDVENMKSYKRCYQRKSTGRARRWREYETNLFWEALSIVGQDFTLMEWYFKEKKVVREKSELRSKFHREDKLERRRVNACLKDARERPLNMRDFFGAEEAAETSSVVGLDADSIASPAPPSLVGSGVIRVGGDTNNNVC